jgi:uncharacterized membrane protein
VDAEWAPLLNGRALNWLGLVSRKPFTEDYVPVLPWLGIIWWGLAAGQWLLSRPVSLVPLGVPLFLRPLASLGRWSLSYYMVHQPVMIGGLMVLGWVLKR